MGRYYRKGSPEAIERARLWAEKQALWAANREKRLLEKVKRREKRLEVLEEQSCCRTSVSHDRSNKLKRHSIIPKNMLCNICNCVRAKTTQWNTKVFPVCCRGCAKRGVKRGKYKKGK